jgi:AraC-like DNA-binding protein
MARLTSLVSRNERAGESEMHPLQARIGRVDLEFVGHDGTFARNQQRLDDLDEAAYLLAFPLTGSTAFSQDGRAGIARPGEYVLLSENAFYELSAESNARLLLVRIPAAELRGRLVSIEDHVSRRFTPNGQMTRLLAEMVRNVAELFIDAPAPNPQALATEIIGLVALTISSEDRGAAIDVRNARYHLRRRIVDFIDAHLGDQTLSPKKIAANSRISQSYLYSLFNDDETTVGQFVLNKRLQRAYEILVADPKGHRTVSEIAYEVGFKNVSHFSRCFSRRFKIAPRDVRHAKTSAGGTSRTRPRKVLAPKLEAAPTRFDSPYWTGDRRRVLQQTP